MAATSIAGSQPRKALQHLQAALALHWAFNFTWMHSAIRCTPAMAVGICRKPLRVGDLLMAS
jgi:hypothetical protein